MADTDGLVERLRNPPFADRINTVSLHNEAADYITFLEAQLAEMRTAGLLLHGYIDARDGRLEKARRLPQIDAALRLFREPPAILSTEGRATTSQSPTGDEGGRT